jgi:glycosyltransferase involved in cell wall biosynthesis
MSEGEEAPPLVLAHLVGLGSMGGIERCYSEYVAHTAARRHARHHTWLTSAGIAGGLRSRVAEGGGPVEHARHLAGFRIPRWAGALQRRRLASLAAASGADAAVLWSNPGWLAFVPDGLPIVYYEHGAAWFGSVFERVRERLDRPVGFIACSFAAKRMLELRWGVDPGRIHVCLNAVRADCVPETLPEREPPPPGRVRLGAVGRMIPLKGFVIAVHALAELRRRGVEATLDLAGDGPERAQLAELAAKTGVAEHVRFRGFVSDMAEVYREIDLLLVPSLREPFGLINAEAMAQGVPVVSAAIDGIPEVVVDGETGLCLPPTLDVAAYLELGGSRQDLPPLCYDPVGDRLIEPRALDPAAVAEAVVALLADPERYGAMRDRGRERVEARFTEDRYVARLDALLREAVGEDARAPDAGSPGPRPPAGERP